MSKVKKLKKKLKERGVQRYVEDITGTNMLRPSRDIQARAEEYSQYIQENSLEKDMAESKIINGVQQRVLTQIAPYLEEIIVTNLRLEKIKKKQNKTKRMLEDKISALANEQKCLCKAMSYLASAMQVSNCNASAIELEKDFKNLHKRFKKKNESNWFIEESNRN